MHYVTRRSHLMQKHKFGVTCSGTLFVKSVPVPHEHEKNESSFRACMHHDALCDPQIKPDAKTQVQCNLSRHALYGNLTGPTRA
jgi:hypothetical protein